MTAVRRKPSQERSREKVDALLTAAKQLIGERGNDAVSMREIAKQAGVAPSSIYQYFPDKNAILAAIMNGYYERIRQMLHTLVESTKNLENLSQEIQNSIDQFYQLFLNEPALATIWAGVQANTVLRELDNEDSIQNAELLAGKLCQLLPHTDTQEAFDSSLLLVQMIGLTVRMALSREKTEGDRLIQELKKIVLLRVRAFS